MVRHVSVAEHAGRCPFVVVACRFCRAGVERGAMKVACLCVRVHVRPCEPLGKRSLLCLLALPLPTLRRSTRDGHTRGVLWRARGGVARQ